MASNPSSAPSSPTASPSPSTHSQPSILHVTSQPRPHHMRVHVAHAGRPRQRPRSALINSPAATSSTPPSTSTFNPTSGRQPRRWSRFFSLFHPSRRRRSVATPTTTYTAAAADEPVPVEEDEPSTLRAHASSGASSSVTSYPDLDAIPEHDLLANIVHRFFDDYSHPPADVYVRQARHRLAMRVQSAYLLPRRAVDPELEQQQPQGEPLATDAQVEALPSFVMEKGERRAVRDIFDAMRRERSKRLDDYDDEDDDDDDEEEEYAGEGDTATVVGDEDDDQREEHLQQQQHADSGKCKEKRADDEAGGLMTSYTECAVCLCDFEAGDEITQLPCGHFFHLDCVREWLTKHARTCPTCRADICADGSAGTAQSSSE